MYLPAFVDIAWINFSNVALLCSKKGNIDYFIVTGGKDAGVDLVFIQPFLPYYVNHVVLMQTGIF